MERIDCDICGKEISGTFRTLNIEYLIKKAPIKAGPYIEKTAWDGFIPISGTIPMGSGKALGTERFVEDAKICDSCNLQVERILDRIKNLFQK